ncbi:hypothetical protein F5B22DRAFT_623339 [Xylaria bambusicola]|uniref:uncharacterized protein n=1 Tax=Xylaria bambusicola TaxID=326684 RepID=UPI0020071FF0|nr:uncharacterized protein F5B22DRAFT_623339 [Xylaria bambusicola]KAI0506505.1 hypothetical protein F5B22DRAFT_623339 [Xylaria bambusicola]
MTTLVETENAKDCSNTCNVSRKHSSDTHHPIPLETVGVHAPDHPAIGRYMGQHSSFAGSLVGERLYFHACTQSLDTALLRSFQASGPSLRFAHGGGYLCRSPAVYWTNSLEFALLWCFLGGSDRHDEEVSVPRSGLIFVSRLDISCLATSRTLVIRPPEGDVEEIEFVKWCKNNKELAYAIPSDGASTVGANEHDLIASRIPMNNLQWVESHGIGQSQNIWIYAACDEYVSTSLANHGIEILLFSA